MNIGIVGLGFVKVLTAGYHHTCQIIKILRVYGYEVNKKYTELIKNRKPPFYEPGLEESLNNSIMTYEFFCE